MTSVLWFEKVSNDDKEVVFLYKLKRGPTESSFGLNVAKMSGLPDSIIEMATKLAEEFEQKMSTWNNVCKQIKLKYMLRLTLIG